MFKSMFIAAALVGALFVSGCASVPMASATADSAAKSFATDPAKANVYIYRHENFGAAIKMPVLIDNVAVGDTAANTYIFKQVEPGKHVITSKTENDATLTVDAKAGSNHFVWQEVKMGMFAARSELHLVEEDKARKDMAECKLVQ